MLFKMERIFMFYKSFFLEDENDLLQEQYIKSRTKEERLDVYIQIMINDGKIAENDRHTKFLGELSHRQYEWAKSNRQQ